jgi:hypothetical protein
MQREPQSPNPMAEAGELEAEAERLLEGKAKQ